MTNIKNHIINFLQWVRDQMDRYQNPLKYETSDERNERHRREDREHAENIARISSQPQQVVMQHLKDRRF